MTNVRKGDLAIVVAPYAVEGRGAFVTILRPHVRGQPVGGRHFASLTTSVCWVVGGWVRAECGLLGPELVIADCSLRRVNPGDGVDEMLREAGHPMREADLDLSPRPQREHAR